MPSEDVPHAVRGLIAERIDSVPELEAILLLRENRNQNWTAEQAGRRLYVSTTVATYVLNELCGRGFFARVGDTFRYDPESPELAQAVDQLALAYTRHLVAVTQMVHSKPGRDVLEFADAFRLRKPR